MSSIFNLSLPLANAVYFASYVMVVIGAVLTLVGTIGLFWSDGIRDKYADERIASNEAATAVANAEAAKANAEAAGARAEAAALQVEAERLKRLVSWRRLSPLQHKTLVAHLRGKLPEGLWVETVGDDPEASQLHQDLIRAFEEAGIKVHWFTGWEVAVGVGIVNGPEASKQALRDAFRAIGVVLDEKRSGMIKDEQKAAERVELIVGSKPPPEFPKQSGGMARPAPAK